MNVTSAPPTTAPAAVPALDAPAPAGGPVTRYARGAGVLVTALGVLGALPGATSNYDAMGLFRSDAHLFGLFTTSATSASLQVLFGLTVLAFSGSPRQAHKAVCWTALAYLVAAVAGAGLVVNSPSPVLPVNVASNWLHLGLGLALAVGAAAARRRHVAELGVF
ncbi:DUF4383 domain-containing protein [Kineococcus radiotolerans]|uniref:DUF4383 domain-containing protein n=1 Tax=Kineococcus radiotolerans (strain ATCC BAA-149 / DSM 14245 / SRS30216) TaxID=266940 RepID=A6WFH6_KINRD|nr:DUF4383 domain-containing protein [Kineococcus radiotolerans]ABS05565.1 hypothetical protein Krad_4102 [Kineococcus radiotolerans SRS30216 = ATCC BAA-149]